MKKLWISALLTASMVACQPKTDTEPRAQPELVTITQLAIPGMDKVYGVQLRDTDTVPGFDQVLNGYYNLRTDLGYVDDAQSEKTYLKNPISLSDSSLKYLQHLQENLAKVEYYLQRDFQNYKK